MATLEPLPIGADPFAGAATADKDPRLEPLLAGADPFVNAVPGATPEDEASPIPTEDIVEGRQRIAAAEAQKRANDGRKSEPAVPVLRFDGQPARTPGIEAEPVETEGGRALQPTGAEPLDEEAVRKITDIARIAARALPAVGPRHAAIGIKRRNNAISSQECGLPNADFRLLERHGIADDPTQAATFLGAVNKAQKEGKSPKAGTGYAEEVLATTAGQAGVPIPPKYLGFVETQVSFALGVRRKDMPRLSEVLMSGVRPENGYYASPLGRLFAVEAFKRCGFGSPMPVLSEVEAPIEAPTVQREPDGTLLIHIDRRLGGISEGRSPTVRS